MLVAIIVVSALVVLILITSLITYFIAFYSPHKGQTDVHRVMEGASYDDKKERMLALIDNFLAVPYETVQTKSYDGLTLFARYYHVDDAAPLAICVHGYRGTGVRDFCGGAPLLIRQKQNVLVIEHRGHGISGGHTITFGVKEHRDVLAWIDFALKSFGSDKKILLYGISMGAATVLITAGKQLPQNVVGVVADCPYTSPRDIVRKVCKDMKMPPAIFYPFLWLGAVLFGRFNPNRESAVEGVKNAKIPILLIHGEADQLVPWEMGKKIVDANPEKVQFESFPGAAHGISFMTDKPRYEKVSADFIQKVLANSEITH